MKLETSLLAGILALWIVSCASAPPICQPENARGAGFALAQKGAAWNPEIGSSCGDESLPFFEAGYQEGRRRYCDQTAIEVRGWADGQAGKDWESTEDLYKICENRDALASAYKKNYQRGLDTYCAPDKINSAAINQGERGLAADFTVHKYRVCGADRLDVAHKSYEKGYAEGLNRFCSGGRVESDAYRDGSEGKTRANLDAKYSVCSETQRQGVLGAYDKGYERGLADYCSPKGVEMAARRQAQDTASPDFPPGLSLCTEKFPDARLQYPDFFKVERKKFVESHCNYQGGLVQGQKDAEEGQEKRSGMPAYCDADVFAVYREGYLQGWKETKDRICDQARAYNKGIEDARGEREMAFNVPAECPADYHTTLLKKYRDGYYYAKNSPKVLASADTEAVYERPYSGSDAEKACRNAGHSSKACDGVTSIACIGKGFPPYECRIDVRFLAAVDACFQKGHAPKQCKTVKDRECINAGKSPFLCGNPPAGE